MTDSVLAVDGLQVDYNVNGSLARAVSAFTLEVRAGERVAVVGESGSGKTTACMAIAGLLPEEAVVSADVLRVGAVGVLDRRQLAVPRRVAGVAVVFQNAMTALDPVWTVESQLAAVIREARPGISRGDVRSEAHDWVEKVGIRDAGRVLRSRPYQLSGGMRQRIMLAIAMSASPMLLIADEPTSALDMTLARDLMDLMIQLTDDMGTALLMITHNIGLCRTYTDWTVVMHQGLIVEQGPSGRVTVEPAEEYSKRLVACAPSFENMDSARLPTMQGWES